MCGERNFLFIKLNEVVRPDTHSNKNKLHLTISMLQASDFIEWIGC